MRSICVFCGSSTGNNPAFVEGAKDFAKYMVEQNLQLIYGGGNVGLMGVIADEVLSLGGEVIGVMPTHIVRHEIAHVGLTRMYEVDSMAERKAMMISLSDAFVALPGGFGTLDEIFEVITHNQLRLIDKPVGILNVEGYFDGVIQFMLRGVRDQLLRKDHVCNIAVTNNSKHLLEMLNNHEPVDLSNWIEDIKNEPNK